MKNIIIDTHAHIFPDKIALKAAKNIGDFYQIAMCANGSIEQLLSGGSEINVTKYIVHSTATTPHQVHAINDFIVKSVSENDSFVGLATLHPDLSENEIAEELVRASNNGLKGVKLHPDFQQFNIDDSNAFKIYHACELLNLPILFHTGDKRHEYSRPFRLAKIAKEFPKLRVIGAHFGGYDCWEQVMCYKGLDNVYFDTSSSLFKLDKKQAVALIHTFGAEKFFFGVDYPMWKHKEELDRFLNLGLSDEENEKILYKNALDFYRLKNCLNQ